MTRNILLVIIIALLLWSVVILCDIRQALYSAGSQDNTRLDKNELPKKPGKLVPNPALPQWEL